jgi:hypothetical protein
VNVVIGTSNVLAMWKISVNKKHRRKTLILLVEINNHIVESLVDIRASMSILVASVVME